MYKTCQTFLHVSANGKSQFSDVHGNGEDWDPTSYMGFPWEWELA